LEIFWNFQSLGIRPELTSRPYTWQVCVAVFSLSPKKPSQLMGSVGVSHNTAPRFIKAKSPHSPSKGDKHSRLAARFTGLPLVSGSPGATAFLEAHNGYRAEHHAPPVTWDDSLASAAEAYASSCVRGHDQNRGHNIGENIYTFGSSNEVSVEDPSIPGTATKKGYSEVKDWDFATSSSNGGGVTGHFTQVVWKATTAIGCGIASCPGMMMANSIFVVCRYSPAGNFLCPSCDPPSTYADNVLPG
jgi:hypothetical protein